MLDYWPLGRAIVMATNSELEENSTILGGYIPEEMRTFTTADTVEDEEENSFEYPMKMGNTISQESALPEHIPNTEKKFVEMILCNLDPNSRHVTERKDVVRNMTRNDLLPQFGTAMRKRARLTLTGISCGPIGDHLPIPGFKRLQFSNCVCFAITANKAQGQSFGEMVRNKL